MHTTTALTRLVACALLAASLCRAQSDGGVGSDADSFGNGGNNTIQGRVYLPSGRRPERRLRVRLSSVRNETSTMTDDTGSFTFRRLGGGTYRITVDAGRGYEPAVESVDIFDAPPGSPAAGPGQTVTVQIRLEPKADEAGAAEAGTIDAALASVPAKARELYLKAQRAARAGDHKAAVEHLKRAVAEHPAFPVAYNELGVQYARLGELERAAEALGDGIKVAPDQPMLRLNLGGVLIQQKKFAAAEAALREALRRDASLAAAHLYLGRALIGLARLDEAERELREALRLGGERDFAVAYRYLGALHVERGERESAARTLETYLRLAPGAREAAEIRELIKELRAPTAPPRQN